MSGDDADSGDLLTFVAQSVGEPVPVDPARARAAQDRADIARFSDHIRDADRDRGAGEPTPAERAAHVGDVWVPAPRGSNLGGFWHTPPADADPEIP